MDIDKPGAQIAASPGPKGKEPKDDDFLPQDCENLLGRVLAGNKKCFFINLKKNSKKFKKYILSCLAKIVKF